MDFRHIIPQFGGKREAFEEFCCQLARRTLPGNADFTRLHGAGGDGGVECFADLPDGSRIGWQAKYVFDIRPLLKQGRSSLATAQQIHPSLAKYILCFPFDLTGPTGSPGQGSSSKFEEWRQSQEKQIAESGRSLEIEAWPANKLYSLLIELDISGGIRSFFFDEGILSPEWFDNHIETARNIAGPRYNPELNVATDVGDWLAAFGRTPEWVQQVQDLYRGTRKHYSRFSRRIKLMDRDSTKSNWPAYLLDEGLSVSDMTGQVLKGFDILRNSTHTSAYWDCLNLLNKLLPRVSSLEDSLTEDLEKQYGPGRAGSPGFRQFMAERMGSLPAENLDATRELSEALVKLRQWLESPTGSLAFRSAFVLSGAWGVGKTHIVCDVASQRLKKGFLSCVIFGHQFGGEPDPWTRLAESLGLPPTFGKDKLLDMLNAAAEGSGQPLILFIDAINETPSRQYWRDRLLPMIEEIGRRANLRICITCRTPYLKQCLPESHGLFVLEHRGFKGAEHVASTAFFRYYGLIPPVAPILQPEFGNPLYLRLTCETVCSLNMDRLPLGWIGTEKIMKAFLGRKEEEFSRDMDVSLEAGIVTTALRSIARSMLESGMTGVSRSQAIRLLREVYPNREVEVIEWMRHANLLIEEVSDNTSLLEPKSTLRLAFERLGDLLVALQWCSELSDSSSVDSAFAGGGPLNDLVQDVSSVEANHGLLSALSILIPEKYSGKELSSLPVSDQVHDALLEIVLSSIPWRDPKSFSHGSKEILLKALNHPGFFFTAMDNLLSIAWRPSTIDSWWLHDFLIRIPLAKRDASWSWYLHRSYERAGSVKRLIDAAFELPFDVLDEDVAERWAAVLLWFTAAADRRIKDWATRALLKIVVSRTMMIPMLLKKFFPVDDDAVRERLLLVTYGALIISWDAEAAKQSLEILYSEIRSRPENFDNALLRDHFRCIADLARKLGVPVRDLDLSRDPIGLGQPLEGFAEEDMEEWERLLHFGLDEFSSDFFKYTMNSLSPWMHEFPKEHMGKWILRRIVQDLGYLTSGCERYDNYMLVTYGGGRGRPIWAERIGKKYQWIALYQLASRLHDQIERKKEQREPEPLGAPLILLQKRQFDPTIVIERNREEEVDPWWVTISLDIDQAQRLSDEAWVAKKEDVPTLGTILSVVARNEQYWRPFVAYLSEGKRDEDADWEVPYRNIWIQVHSYLLRECDLESALSSLRHRNFFGQRMPSGSSWPHGFAGEYPWAAPFNFELEEWHGLETSVAGLQVALQPSWSTLEMEWEYDSSVENYHMLVPARPFFTTANLWWNGENGYRLDTGKTVFQDPAVTVIAPSALMGDVDYVSCCLDKLGLRLVWTLIGAKWMLGGPPTQRTPRYTFSQVAYLCEDNSVQAEKLVFSEDNGRDAGPRSTG